MSLDPLATGPGRRRKMTDGVLYKAYFVTLRLVSKANAMDQEVKLLFYILIDDESLGILI